MLSLLTVNGQEVIPSPREHFGFNIGDDYTLATWSQTESYFRKLASSPRAKLVDIGITEEGRHQLMLVVSSPENIKNLGHYREISEKLARAENLTEGEARKLADEGKAVVWIDGGLHATEVVGSHQLIEIAWQLVSRNDNETEEILKDVIVLLVAANPDGQELVSTWYMRNSDPSKRKMNIPRLYEKYIGHDNNRDFFMLSMKETQNMSRQLYLEWFPQVLYNHHQAGPAGTVLAGPPYRDPFNYLFDPLLVTGIDALGAAMVNRLNSENKPGYTERTGSSFSTWYNGGLRTTAYFHNMIGLLTEIIGSPTPSSIPLVPDRLLPNGATPYPVGPREWRFRMSIDYSVSLDYAILDYASRYRNEILFNIYRMGRNSIEKGSSDHWTYTPSFIEAIKSAPAQKRDSIMHDPARKDARVYIIPSDQADYPTAVRFVNALIGSGIKVMKARTAFTVKGHSYSKGSYIIKTDQAFRPHVLDMFEPQDHPEDLQYPGGPPIPPYDAAGWTLAYQMGLKFDRFTEDVPGPFDILPYGKEESFSNQVSLKQAHNGYELRPSSNNSFIAVNDLLKKGVVVYRILKGKGKADTVNTGSFYIPWSEGGIRQLESEARKYGLYPVELKRKPANIQMITPARIALVNRYGGSMASGWISWILEQYHFSYEMIYNQKIDSGELKKKYDIIIFSSDVIPRIWRASDTLQRTPQSVLADIPEEYRYMTGSFSNNRSLPELKKFIENGGTAITIGNSSLVALSLGAPVKNALLKKTSKGELPLSNSEFYIPGSLLNVNVDNSEMPGWGMPRNCSVYFEQDPVFRADSTATTKVRPVMWYPESGQLKSGWALGQRYLDGAIAAFSYSMGSGMLYSFGPEITFRSQSQGTFRLLFNVLYKSHE